MTKQPISRPDYPLQPGSFEERYLDVLQNIEFGIVQVYQEHPDMTNWDALNAIEALIRIYQAESKGRESTPPNLPSPSDQVYQNIKVMCEWRLGREALFQDEKGKKAAELQPSPITLDELLACLKRVRKSINYWTRQGGREAYLDFVSQFVR